MNQMKEYEVLLHQGREDDIADLTTGNSVFLSDRMKTSGMDLEMSSVAM